MRWRFIDTGPHSGAFNMRFDEALAEHLQRGTGPPTVRVYQWQPWAVSLGYHQSSEEIDQVRCQARGIDIIRNEVGG